MDFYDALEKVTDNVSVTENGMVGYKTTYHPLLDMNFKVSSYRHCSDEQIKEDLKKVLASEDNAYILKFLFYVRDVREGLGERRLFRVMLKELVSSYNFENKDEIVTDLIKNQIKEYGRFDDLLAVFIDTKYEQLVFETIQGQLKTDWVGMKNNKPISLLAKWMPSVNASSNKTKTLAKKLIKAFNISQKQYRQSLSALRNYLKVTETFTSANEWDKIDYNQVPSKANIKYNGAFLRHDEERRRDFLAALRVGVDKDGKEVKINSSVNFPHDVLHMYTSSERYYYGTSGVEPYDEAIEQLWKNLKQKEGLNNTIVVRDDSGSMTSRIGGTNITAYEVATALGIYCAEHNSEAYKNKIITFSRTPRYLDFSDSALYASLHSKYEYLNGHSEVADTNIEAVFDLILKTAVENKLKADELPAQILILSDMEFNSCTVSNTSYGVDNTLFSHIAAKYAQYGYKLPKLVFWNLDSRTNTIPMKQNEAGVVLVSGFSVNTLNMVLNGETDPFKAMIKELDVPRYSAIPLLNLGHQDIKKSTKKSAKVDVDKIGWLS